MTHAPSSRLISNITPIRICDLGGWTDTWFAGHGHVLNVAVEPYVQVQIDVNAAVDPGFVALRVANYDDEVLLQHGQPHPAHPLLAATINRFCPPQAPGLRISIASAVPPGASCGTSAAVVVGLISALSKLAGNALTPHQIAQQAHSIETDDLGLQSGIQDQLSVAFGGVNAIAMPRYPASTVTTLPLSQRVHHDLSHRLVLIYLGKSHVSSAVHEQIIQAVQQHDKSAAFEALRQCALAGQAALLHEDLDAFGRIMIRNTAAQRSLHTALISDDAQQIIDVARQHDARGWKVNGAGGEGGTMTILASPKHDLRRNMIAAILQSNASYTHIPTRLSTLGTYSWEF